MSRLCRRSFTGPPEPPVGSAPATSSAGTRGGPKRAFLVVAPPVYLRLVVQPEDQVGEQLEQVLPQQQRHVKVNVAYVRLAHVSSVAHVAHAHELVDEVVAVAPVLAGVGLALVQLLLAPADTEAARRSGSTASERRRARDRGRRRRRRLLEGQGSFVWLGGSFILTGVR